MSVAVYLFVSKLKICLLKIVSVQRTLLSLIHAQ